MPVNVFGWATRIQSVVGMVSTNGGRKEITVRRTEIADCPGETLRLLRGARLITDLEAQIVSCPHGSAESRQNSRLEHRLDAISRDYQLASKMMSLVAVVDAVRDRGGMVPRTHVVSTGLPRSADLGLAARHSSSSIFSPGARVVLYCKSSLEEDDLGISGDRLPNDLERFKLEIDPSPSLEPFLTFGPNGSFKRKQKDRVHWINCLRKAIKKLDGTSGDDQESLVFEILAAMMHITAKVDPEVKSIMEDRKFMASLVRFLKDSPKIPGLPDGPGAMADRLIQYPRETLGMETRITIMEKLTQTDGAFDAAGVSSVYKEFFENEPTRTR
jgi:hypothetical protein